MITHPLEGKVAIITGAGRGLGREIALRFALAGASVVLASRTQRELDATRSEVISAGGEALAVNTDVTKPEAVRHLVQETVDRFRRIDILVNNAAVSYVSSLLLSQDESWKHTFDVNVFGTYLCTKAALPYMIRAKSGRIINISSIAGKMGVPLNSAYAASKAAVIGFTRALAVELASLEITVNAICPWHMETKLMADAMTTRGALFGRSGEQHTTKIAAMNPQRRMITLEEVAGLALFLTSPEARGITGQALNQCGGALTS
jgi:3-oxoacyl-[acyl-carrier protein] reductase